ncbi:MAG: glycosyltransferase family 2 protein [Pseudomonadota bacterium]
MTKNTFDIEVRRSEETPKVSVVIPAYKAGEALESALNSVTAQTFRSFEVIVVDDASGDDTVDRAAGILHATAFDYAVISLKKNGGPANARNHGVRAARGEYVAFLDADDEWLPEKLAAQVAIMDSDKTITLCGCQATWRPTDGSSPYPLYRNLPDIFPTGWKTLLWNCFIATPCAVARRSDLGEAPFDLKLRVGEDRDLWIRLASNGKVALAHDNLVNIRLSPSSYMASNVLRIKDDIVPMIERHLSAFADVLGAKERRLAYGKLSSDIGKALCLSKPDYPRGVSFLLKAAANGYQPFASLWYVMLTAPIVRDVKPGLKAMARTMRPEHHSAGPERR